MAPKGNVRVWATEKPGEPPKTRTDLRLHGDQRHGRTNAHGEVRVERRGKHGEADAGLIAYNSVLFEGNVDPGLINPGLFNIRRGNRI